MGRVVQLRPVTADLFGEEHLSPPPSDLYDQAWPAMPDTMRKRSDGRTSPNMRKMWDKHAKLAGGEPSLLEALRGYIQKDPDVALSGGMGLQVWLNKRKWEHWLPVVRPVVARRLLEAPDGYRERFVALLGEEFVTSWIDQCRWVGGKLIVPREYTMKRLSLEFRQKKIPVVVALDG